MSFFDRLFIFRQRETRAPLEDFLTELLAEWLREATAAGRINDILTGLFQLPETRLPAPDALPGLVWETQHVIGPGHRGEGKRPDLVGRGKDFFFIIENKIAAGFTWHQDDHGEIDQLNLYDEYRRDRSEPGGGIALLTQSTLPPAGWAPRTLYWSTVEQYLRSFASDSTPVLNYLTQQLIAFLGEHGMNGTRIALADITAYPAYQRLMEGLSSLGRIAGNRLSIGLQNVDLQKLKAPRGGANGEFAWPKYHGLVLSEGGIRCNEACFVAWGGVVTDAIYEVIQPASAGIPDICVGFGLWCAEEAPEAELLMNSLLASLIESTQTPWTLSTHYRDGGYGPILLLSARRSLIDLHVQADGGDLDDIAGEFFEMHGQAVLQALAQRIADDESVDSRLLALAYGSNPVPTLDSISKA